MHLYDAGFIVNFTIGYDLAEKVYNEHFKKQKISFKRFLRAMSNFCILSIQTNTTLVFVERSLCNIIRYAQTENKFQGISPIKSTPKKDVVVSQASAFRQQWKPEELVNQTLCNICNIPFRSKSDYDTHLLDVRHILRNQYVTQRYVGMQKVHQFCYNCFIYCKIYVRGCVLLSQSVNPLL